jgi:uncharacterized membrane protein YhaH (DUF805 family)
MELFIHDWFSFSGRAQRSRFFFGVVCSVLLLLWGFLGAPMPHFLWMLLPGACACWLRFLLFSTVKVIGAVSLASFHVRRCHDRGLSGWWAFFVGLWYALGGFLFFRSGVAMHLAMLTVLPLPTWILTLLPGSKTENRYGVPPKERS